jgi:hypothetical protein
VKKAEIALTAHELTELLRHVDDLPLWWSVADTRTMRRVIKKLRAAKKASRR